MLGGQHLWNGNEDCGAVESERQVCHAHDGDGNVNSENFQAARPRRRPEKQCPRLTDQRSTAQLGAHLEAGPKQLMSALGRKRTLATRQISPSKIKRTPAEEGTGD